jgi:hypothetical protein
LNSGFKLISLLFVLIVTACSKAPPPPTCRIAQAFNADYTGPAGCLIRVQDKLLVLKHSSSDLYDLPFGDPISEESAQCTAHRNTWEKTGFNVEVDQLLGVTQSGIMLFSCSLSGGFTSEDGPISPPSWVDSQIQHIDFIDPFDTRHDLWQNPDNLIMYRDGFVMTNNGKNMQVPAQ